MKKREEYNKEKESKIRELQRQIEEIKNEVPMNFQLVEVVPDCGGGVRDSEKILAISSEEDTLINLIKNHKIMNTKKVSNEEKGNGVLADVMHCCEINCKDKAVFQVQDIGEGKTYEDYTHCCEEHLGEMIGDNTLHEVRRLEIINNIQLNLNK